MTKFGTGYHQRLIAWLEGEIAKLKKSRSREMIKDRIAKLEDELASLKARYPVNPETPPSDAAATL